MESFRGSLKTGFIRHCRFATREQARRQVTEYVEVFYNPIRKEARLPFPGRISTAVFGRKTGGLTRRAPRLTTDLKPPWFLMRFPSARLYCHGSSREY